MSGPATGPHAGQPVATAGRPAGEAEAAMILVHGRGATAESILTLSDEIGEERLAYLAPQAAGFTWYPQSFLAPVERNEPGRSSGLSVIEGLVDRLGEEGVPPERVILLGFSQGACLATEFAARHPRRYGGVVALTGGLIGPDEALTGFAGSLAGTPLFLGSSDPDVHVPWSRVEETARIYRDLGAEVTLRRFPGMGHTVNREEIENVREIVAAVLEGA